jgi:membrane protein YdbS with pleckstrin-like domain
MHRMTAPNVKEQRRLMLILVASVVALDSAIIGIYQFMHIAQRPAKTQETFVAVWVVLTLLVVPTQMKKIRRFRPPRRVRKP